jgi:hypothetical protein
MSFRHNDDPFISVGGLPARLDIAAPAGRHYPATILQHAGQITRRPDLKINNL